MASRRLVILGGNGFVGSAVAEEALRRGLEVLCLSRSGRCTAPHAWASRVRWERADALQPDTYREHLRGAEALVVSIGSPPLPFQDRAYQMKMNGETNAVAARTAKAAGVPQLVLINAAMPRWLTPEGYRAGKLVAEAAAKELVDGSFGAAVLKPGAIYGTRYVGNTPVPLWAVLGPASALMRNLWGPLRANAPVSVDLVASAAVDAATSAAFHGQFRVLDIVALFTRQSAH